MDEKQRGAGGREVGPGLVLEDLLPSMWQLALWAPGKAVGKANKSAGSLLP